MVFTKISSKRIWLHLQVIVQILFCDNHSLELVLSNAVDEVLYILHNNSSKNQRQLAECAAQFDKQMKKIGKIISTRWVASSFRAVSVVWHSFAFLYNHFSASKDDKSRSQTERAMYSGLIR
ncbi:hypothetical protein PR048_026295 [Dryococelus australis]|uniref:Uncharacterized protein n=1 Tax=Dryococelus australis TaxID=614101 RepID=A0ABQ9GKZ1_9NEOP|nr:hypothetical protein PR048_026295 [Dryococelus australis]